MRKRDLKMAKEKSLEFARFYPIGSKEKIGSAENVNELYEMYRDEYKLLFMSAFGRYMSEKETALFFKDAWGRSPWPEDDDFLNKDMAVALFKKARKYLIKDAPENVKVYHFYVSLKLKKYIGISWFGYKTSNDDLLCVTVGRENILAYFPDRDEYIIDIDAVFDKIEVV